LSSHLTPLCLTSALPDWSASAPLCTHPHTSFSSEIFSRSFPSPTTLFVTETRVHPGGICHRCGPHWKDSRVTYKQDFRQIYYQPLLYVTPESFQCLFGDSLNRMDSFSRAQPATAAKPRWLPPFVRGTFPTTVKVTYPLYEWTKPPARGMVPTKLLTVQLPPKEGETEATNIPWDKVAPGMMLRIRVSPLFKTRSS